MGYPYFRKHPYIITTCFLRNERRFCYHPPILWDAQNSHGVFLQKGPTNQQLGLNKRQGQVQSEMVLKGLIQTTDFFKERFKKKNNNGKKICSRFSNHPSCFVMLVFETLFVSTFYPMPCSFSKTPVEKKQKCFHTIWMFQKIGGFSPQIHPILIGFSIINDPLWGTFQQVIFFKEKLPPPNWDYPWDTRKPGG